MELRVPRDRKGSKRGIIAAGGSLRLKLLEHIFREGAGRDQRHSSNELREQMKKPQGREAS